MRVPWTVAFCLHRRRCQGSCSLQFLRRDRKLNQHQGVMLAAIMIAVQASGISSYIVHVEEFVWEWQ